VRAPLSLLAEALSGIDSIGREYGVETCNWGHAGDGNIHATFLVDPANKNEIKLAEAATEDVFKLAVHLAGAVSGEHGIGLVKAGQLSRQWSETAIDLHESIKRVFDPEELLNPGKKLPR
jgi:FAD/FMN-containing dehydrogenase